MARRRRPTETLSAALTPRRGIVELPAFSPDHPATGWTPAAAVAAAEQYAAEHASASEHRAYAAAAYSALICDDRTLRRRAVLERLDGVDHFVNAYRDDAPGWRPTRAPADPAPF